MSRLYDSHPEVSMNRYPLLRYPTTFSRWVLAAVSLLVVLFGSQCGVITPGINGLISLGDGYLVAENAQQMVIAVYKPSDFDTTQMRPKNGAEPLAHKVLNNVNRPPYLYELEVKIPSQRVYVFAFLDQDNSGGLALTHNDLYGVHLKNPVEITDYRIFNVFVRLDKIYNRPPLRFEVNHHFSIPKPTEGNRLFVGLWRPEEIGSNGIPKEGMTPLSYAEMTDFTPYPPWILNVKVDHLTEDAIPFVFVDRDNKGGYTPTENDAYLTWKADPIPLKNPVNNKLEVVLDSTYKTTP